MIYAPVFDSVKMFGELESDFLFFRLDFLGHKVPGQIELPLKLVHFLGHDRLQLPLIVHFHVALLRFRRRFEIVEDLMQLFLEETRFKHQIEIQIQSKF